MMHPHAPTLQTVARCLYTFYYAKAALCYFNPALAQEKTDFCFGCNLSSDAGHVTGQYEIAQNLFIAFLYTAVSRFDSEKAQKHIICWGCILPLLKLLVLARIGQATLGDGNVFWTSVGENVCLLAYGFASSKVWHKKATGSMNKPSKFELYSHKAASWGCCLDALVLGLYAAYSVATGETDKFRPNDAGVYGSHMAAAGHLGLAAMYFGLVAVDEWDMELALKYTQLKKFIELFYLSCLAAPFAIAAGGDAGVNGAYATFMWSLVPLLHMMAVNYGPTSLRKIVFWAGSGVSFHCAALCLFYPSSTALALFRVEELSGASDGVVRLLGLGCVGMGSALFAFSQGFEADAFEMNFMRIYGPLLAYSYATGKPMQFGMFSDCLNAFLVWSLYMNLHMVDGLKFTRGLVPQFLRKGTAKVVAAVSPKAKPAPKAAAAMKMRSRSKTPGRKSN